MRRRLAAILIVLLIVMGVIAFIVTREDVAQLSPEAVSGARPKITEARIQNVPTIKIAKAVGWPAGAMPTPAAGLGVNAFAGNLDHPRWLYELPNGDVLVAESNSPPREKHGIADYVMGWIMKWGGAGVPSANRITLLRDTNGDGVADFRSVLLSGLNSPSGMALVGGTLYVGDTDALLAFPYKDGDTRIAAKPFKVVGLPGGGNHWARNVVASPDGKHLYIAVGSSTNIAEHGLDAEDHRANILELSLADKSLRIFAGGLRNPNGMAWEPHTKALWTVVNERDMLGSDLAPDYLTRVEVGDFYGWPYTYWGGYPDARVDPRPDLQQYTRRPDYALGPHVAALGLAFGSLGALQGGAFIGEHGSWNRVPVSGYKLVFVPFGANGAPSGPMRDVLTGFLNAAGQAQGRPVGVIARKSDLLVADDVGNRVWRVAAR